MKRFISVVMTVAIILSMFITTSAATIWETVNGLVGNNDPFEMNNLTVLVDARKSGTSDEYKSSLSLTEEGLSSGVAIDYKATLNMEPIRNLIGNIGTVIGSANQLDKDKFNAATISTDITVTIEYPQNAAIINQNAGALMNDNGIFSEKEARSFNTAERKAVITYKNKDDLTAGELLANKDTYLADLTFVLENNVKYSASGTHTVNVTLAGSTDIKIGGNTVQEITYAGAASNSVTLATPTYSGGGGGAVISTQGTVEFNTGDEVSSQSMKVKFGETITPPEVTREGYILEGWYKDAALTEAFDFTQPIKSNVTLYAKWIALHECRGIHEDNCPCLKFTDLDPTLWYHRGVDYVLNNKMMIGVAKTEFAPDWDVTRAMLVTVLWRAEGMPKGKTTTFTDLEEGLYYVPAVEWAAQNGIVKGYSDFAFGPNDAITREQFAAIMHRYARSKGFDISAGENANIASYADYSTVSEYAIASMKYAVGSGLIKGRTETTLNPKDKTTRAEMATMIYRFYTQLAK